MKDKRFFPVIIASKHERDYTAEFALSMTSILHGSLFLRQFFPLKLPEDIASSLETKEMLNRRESFVRVLCSLPENTTIELHLSAMPNLVHRARGSMSAALFVQVQAGTRHAALEQAALRYLSLMPLLTAYLPEAEFVPVEKTEGYTGLRSGLQPEFAVCVRRQVQEIALSQALKRATVGFLADPSPCPQANDTIRHIFPWIPSMSDWSMLMETMLGSLEASTVILRFRPTSASEKVSEALSGIISTCESFLTGGSADHIVLNRQVGQLRDVSLMRLTGITESCCRLGVFIVSPHTIDTTLPSILGQAITAGINPASMFCGRFSSFSLPVEKALDSSFFPEDDPFTVQEAACAFRLPSPPLNDFSGLPVKRSRTVLAQLHEVAKAKEEGIELFENVHRGMVQPVRISNTERMRHMFVVGQTGTGKSTMMETHILQDIRAGRGVAVIDPHGDLVDGILGRIPRRRKKDTIVFDLLERERPLGFNILHYKSVEDRDLTIDELYRALDRVYDFSKTGGPIFESNFRGMLKLLLPETPRDNYRPTLLEFMMCYQDDDFRNWLKRNTSDLQAIDFVRELEGTTGEAALKNLSIYVTSKFSRFIHDTRLRRITGQETSSLDFDEIMNKGKILLVKLGKGRFGSEVSALLANQLVSRFKLAAMRRGDIPPEERRDFFLYVDEAHNIPSENLQQLLSEARKYRLSLCLATQYASQLTAASIGSRDNLLSAVLGNVGTIVLFRVGQEDANLMAPVFSPLFSAEDIVGLPNWHGIARLQTSGDSLQPFSFKTVKDNKPFDSALAAEIAEYSCARYGRPVELIQKEIESRRTSWKKEEKDEPARGKGDGVLDIL